MGTYRFEVVATYSDVVEVEAESPERAHDSAVDSAPNWIDIGGKMAYTEDVKAYILDNTKENK